MVEKFETQLKKKQQVFVKIQVFAMLIWYLIILENWYIDIIITLFSIHCFEWYMNVS